VNGGPVSYGTQRKAVLEALENFEKVCSKKTHLGRDVGVAVGAKAGLSESCMKRHGTFFNLF
jgi:hypothetical protein